MAALATTHEREIIALTAKMDVAVEERSVAEALARKQADQQLERALAAAKQSHTDQLSDMQALIQRQNQDAKNKMSSLAKAMEGLQNELREESNKNSILMQEISVLR
jgi:hypothetical protein